MQGKLADMYTTMNACRAYVYAVGAGLRPRARPRARTRPARSSTPPRRRRGWRGEAIQCLGGNGYINDYPTGRLWRDAKLYEIGAGTSRDPPDADRPRTVQRDPIARASRGRSHACRTIRSSSSVPPARRWAGFQGDFASLVGERTRRRRDQGGGRARRHRARRRRGSDHGLRAARGPGPGAGAAGGAQGGPAAGRPAARRSTRCAARR